MLHYDKLMLYFSFDVIAWANFFFPHWKRYAWNDAHRMMLVNYMVDCCGKSIRERKGKRRAYIVPRGYGKSTVATTLINIHKILHGFAAYITIFAATETQATQRVSNIRQELEENNRLAEFYSIVKTGVWGQGAFECNGVLVAGHGILSTRRGISKGANRPSDIDLDDIEEDETVKNPLTRQKIIERFEHVIDYLGDENTNIGLAATLIHPEALAAVLAKRADFEPFCFKAIESWPQEMALWNSWEEILLDIDNDSRQEMAREFYERNRGRMDAGAKVLWPERESIYDLMRERASKGHTAFRFEKQNEPIDPATSIFFPEDWTYFKIDADRILYTDEKTGEIVEVPLSSLMFYHWLDPALGQSGEEAAMRKGRRDFSAAVTIGIGGNGRIYITDVTLSKTAGPQEQVESVLDQYTMAGGRGEIAFEANAFQAVLLIPFEAEVQRRRELGQIVGEVTHAGLVQHSNKTARIMRLEPFFNKNWIFVNEQVPPEFLTQFEGFPTADHDDGPDALEGAIGYAQERGALTFVS